MTEQTALLVLDMQEDYVKKYPGLLDLVNSRIKAAKEQGQTVVYIKNRGRRNRVDYVSPLAQGLVVASDLIYEKGGASMFCGSNLLEQLRERKISRLELVGVDGNTCVAASAIEATALGFSVAVILSDIGVQNWGRFANTRRKLALAQVEVSE